MDTKQKTPFELLEFILFVDASKGLLHDTEKIMNHNGITYSMVRKELAIKAMEEYASQYQHPVPDASQPAGNAIEKIKEYLFNTANAGDNINADYLKQTLRFINDIAQPAAVADEDC